MEINYEWEINEPKKSGPEAPPLTLCCICAPDPIHFDCMGMSLLGLSKAVILSAFYTKNNVYICIICNPPVICINTTLNHF